MPVRPELRDRDADGEHEPGHRADIGNEGDDARDRGRSAGRSSGRTSDSAERVERAEDQADRGLPAHEARDRLVHLARQSRARSRDVDRNPVVDDVHHPVPVDRQIERDHRRHDHQREDRDAAPARPTRASSGTPPSSRRPASPDRRPTCWRPALPTILRSHGRFGSHAASAGARHSPAASR